MGRKKYPPEFRAKLIELHRAGRTIAELAQEFEPHETTITSWIAQSERDSGVRSDGLTSEEEGGALPPSSRIKQLNVERELLAKATGWFARETDSIPPKGSN